MGPLRRWKLFFSTFDAIDVAIVQGGEVGWAEELRQTKWEIVEILCNRPEDDAAEDVCKILDAVMEEHLNTLQKVPVPASALASTHLVKSVGALTAHESEKVRCLARETIAGWRASILCDIARARATVEKLRKVSDEDLAPKSRPSIVSEKKTATRSSSPVEMAKSNVPATKVLAPLPKKTAPVRSSGRTNAISTDKMMAAKKMQKPAVDAGRARVGIDDKMEATKRKLREGYQAAEHTKRQRKVVVMEVPPKPVNLKQQQQRKTSTTVQRSLVPSFSRD